MSDVVNTALVLREVDTIHTLYGHVYMVSYWGLEHRLDTSVDADTDDHIPLEGPTCWKEPGGTWQVTRKPMCSGKTGRITIASGLTTRSAGMAIVLQHR